MTKIKKVLAIFFIVLFIGIAIAFIIFLFIIDTKLMLILFGVFGGITFFVWGSIIIEEYLGIK